MPVSLFDEYNREQILLSKYHQKKLARNRDIYTRYWGGVKGMTLKEFVEELKKLGISTTERKIQRFAEKGLIAESKTKNLGRGVGQVADYPVEALAEFYAFHSLKFKPKQNDFREIREMALEAEKKDEGYSLMTGDVTTEKGIAFDWLRERARILEGFKPGDKIAVKYTGRLVEGPDSEKEMKTVRTLKLKE